ncbi:hypothetical protein GPECTOR_10g890 [Gonium pectorale]|uniref:Amino acid transporter transmembrane domain-containing protein n=1 Tax=Gonium pectorale TaxID=33097 RepID=A0A150GQZ4_GONPE|nr:hypothetical protein GPECTOR_10g890 [Gonium pectorale]|eukprot:KXZ52259.1 hypothetical protein GPECTOR_10g890 [Gonium pectorale]
MANSTVGAGVLSLPFAFQATGLLGGLILCVVVGITEALTLYVLSKFAERYKARTYVELVRRALGRKLAVLLSSVLVVAMFGACVAYLIILSDNLSSLAAAANLPRWIADRHRITAFLGIGVLLPMCFPRQLTALARMNQVAVLGFLVGAGLVAYRGFTIAFSRPDPLEGVELLVVNYDSLFAIPIIVFGFNCHSTVVSIFHELEPTPTVVVPVLPSSPSAFRRFRYIPRPASRKLVGMLSVIMASTSLVMAVYVTVGISGYMAFPDNVSSNILMSFDRDDIMVQIARLAVTLIVMGSYPLTHHPARAGFEHLVKPATPAGAVEPLDSDVDALPAGVSRLTSVAFTLAFVLSSTAVAEVVTDLGVVLHLLGGLCISFIIFFLPGLLLINAAILKYSRTVLEELEGQEDGQGVADEEQTLPSSLTQPLLQRLQSARDKGIKKSGIIYAPRLSWQFGTALLVLSVLVAGVTLLTVILG